MVSFVNLLYFCLKEQMIKKPLILIVDDELFNVDYLEQELEEQYDLNDAQETEIHSLKELLKEWVAIFDHTDKDEEEIEAISAALDEAETDDEFLAIVVGYFK